jgi:hypothetical protein
MPPRWGWILFCFGYYNDFAPTALGLIIRFYFVWFVYFAACHVAQLYAAKTVSIICLGR